MMNTTCEGVVGMMMSCYIYWDTLKEKYCVIAGRSKYQWIYVQFHRYVYRWKAHIFLFSYRVQTAVMGERQEQL